MHHDKFEKTLASLMLYGMCMYLTLHISEQQAGVTKIVGVAGFVFATFMFGLVAIKAMRA